VDTNSHFFILTKFKTWICLQIFSQILVGPFEANPFIYTTWQFEKYVYKNCITLWWWWGQQVFFREMSLNSFNYWQKYVQIVCTSIYEGRLFVYILCFVCCIEISQMPLATILVLLKPLMSRGASSWFCDVLIYDGEII
jgi:hypothetical protein